MKPHIKLLYCSMILVLSLCPLFPAFAQTAYDYYRMANEAYEKQDYQNVVYYSKKALEQNTGYGAAYWLLGTGYYYTGDYNNSAAAYTSALGYYATEPSNMAKIYYRRGLAKMKLGDSYGALNDYNTAVEKDPSFKSTYWDRAELYYTKKDYRSAMQDYKKSIELYQGDNESLAILCTNVGDCERFLADYQQAINDYTKALAYNERYGLAYWNRGVALDHLANYVDALKDYTKALTFYQSDPASLSILYRNIGSCKMNLLDYDEALVAVNKALELNNQNRAAYWDRAVIYSDKKMHAESIRDYTTAIGYYSNDLDNLPKLYYWRAYNRRMNKDYEGAVTDYSKAIELRPDYGVAYWERGITYEYMIKFDNAIRDYTSAMIYYANDKKNLAILYNNRATLKRELLRLDDAILDAKKSIELDSTRSRTYYNIGYCYQLKKNLTTAVAYFDKCIELDSTYIEAYFHKGLCYQRSADKKTLAKTFFSQTLQRDDDTCWLSAYSHYYLGNKAGAFQILHHLVARGIKDRMPNDYYNLACLYAIDNNETEAFKQLNLAMKAGYKNYYWMQMDQDLDNIKNKPEFKSLLQQLKQ